MEGEPYTPPVEMRENFTTEDRIAAEETLRRWRAGISISFGAVKEEQRKKKQ